MASGEAPPCVMVCGRRPGDALYIVSVGSPGGPTITEGGGLRPISLFKSLFSLKQNQNFDVPKCDDFSNQLFTIVACSHVEYRPKASATVGASSGECEMHT